MAIRPDFAEPAQNGRSGLWVPSDFQEVTQLFSFKASISLTAGFLIFLAGSTLWGQSFNGRIVGSVTDSSSAGVPSLGGGGE